MDGLDDARHQIYKRRYPYRRVLALLKIIEENETRASYYREEAFFMPLIMKNGRKRQKRLLGRATHWGRFWK